MPFHVYGNKSNGIGTNYRHVFRTIPAMPETLYFCVGKAFAGNLKTMLLNLSLSILLLMKHGIMSRQMKMSNRIKPALSKFFMKRKSLVRS